MDTHKGQEEEEEVNNMDLWSRQVIYEAQKEHFQIEYNFIEISRLPQRVNSVSRHSHTSKPINHLNLLQ